MKVIVSSCGRFHSVHLAKSLQRKNSLQHFFYAGVPKDREFFKQDSLSFHHLTSFADRLYVKFGLDRFFLASRWYTCRDKMFGAWVAKKLKSFQPPTVFVGWANASLESFSCLKKRSLLILEAGSMHVLEQEKILRQEFNLHGLSYPVITAENKSRMLAEIELADFISVPSEHVRESFILQGVSAQKILKVPYGCNLDLFKSGLQKLKNDKMIFLFVGMISLQKGFFYLLQAWERLTSEGFLAEMHVIGSVCSDVLHLLPRAKLLTTFFLHGSMMQSDLKEWYQKADVFVLPSLQEGFAMVIGEAMAAGLCIISTDKSGSLELMQDGVHGFVIQAGKVDQLLDRLRWCINNPMIVHDMGRKSLEIATAYSWQNYGERIFDVYKHLLADQQSLDATSD